VDLIDYLFLKKENMRDGILQLVVRTHCTNIRKRVLAKGISPSHALLEWTIYLCGGPSLTSFVLRFWTRIIELGFSLYSRCRIEYLGL
jgi:hypothetical protein